MHVPILIMHSTHSTKLTNLSKKRGALQNINLMIFQNKADLHTIVHLKIISVWLHHPHK